MLNETTFPSVETLLISGGDERLKLDEKGVNKYGCSPYPDDAILAFSSSTATPLTTLRFQIAQNLRQRIIQSLKKTSEINVYAQEISRQKNRWQHLLALSENISLIFTNSGTDIHSWIASRLVKKTMIIMVDINETGSGVAKALSINPQADIVSIPLRQTDGMPIDMTLIDTKICEYTQKAITKKQDILLILVDQSKTGMIAPSIKNTLALKKHYSQQFNVLVDACQFRISATTLSAYLNNDFMVMVTGSKFLAAPSFSGLLLVPASLDLSDYLERSVINWGLLIRMEIALAEYSAFSQLNEQNIYHVIDDFATSINAYLNNSNTFQSLPTPVINRDGLVDTKHWDWLPTIFPFSIEKNKKNIGLDKTRFYYQQLMHQKIRCQLGQPVLYGHQEGIMMSALRLNLSASLIANAVQHNSIDDCLKNAIDVLQTLEYLIHADH